MVTVYNKDGKPLKVHKIDAKELIDNKNYFAENPKKNPAPKKKRGKVAAVTPKKEEPKEEVSLEGIDDEPEEEVARAKP